MARTGQLFRFFLKPDDGDVWEVVADSRDIYMWEKSTKGASFAKLKDDLHMGDLYAVAWVAARRQKLVGQGETLADFAEAYQLEFETGTRPGEDPEPDPTQPAP